MHDDHDNEHDHEHGEPYEIGPDTIVEDIEGLEMFTLRSVGIDIGSSTSHLVFSHLTLRREGASHSGRFRVTGREVLYRSKIMLTPYLSGTLIDTEKVKDFIHLAYREAGFTPDDIDTGAVVITGEALKKENARPIVEFFAKDSGKFICASAGPNHEALLAAYGSGAVDLSKREKTAVLNVDMGGGTTKFSLIQDGIVAQTASINIGARLIAFDDSDVVTRVEDAGRDIMRQLGYSVALGQKVTAQQKEDFAAFMAEVLFEVIDGGPTSALAKKLMVTEPFKNYRGLSDIGSIVFSGGVSEHIYDHDRTSYGDVGPLLGKYVREQLKKFSRPELLREPNEGIRATVIGAGEYTIQASGTTSYISSAKALPAFGLKVIRVPLNGQDSAAENLRQGLAKFDLPAFTSGLALAFSLDDQPDYQSIKKIAEGIVAVVRDSGVKTPLYLALDIDVAKSLGAILKEELKLAPEVIAVDGIDVGDLDYIDIGLPMGITEVIPVTVKSLMFPSTQLG
ncbi:MAG: recombinase [Deltaproteobacteria bacterium RIFCSPLOWO2_12_FULL_60_19]|nr:MAG: recombinase [Deltaproteobacteria bacterium RIFCSPLOWO2_12_FULL_60_19]